MSPLAWQGARIFAGIVVAVGLAAIVVWAVVMYATRPKEGIVRSAWLEPAHSETYQSSSVCVGHDKNGYCNVTVPIYSTRWVPDRCYVRLDDVEKTHRQADWQVDCATLASFVIGQWAVVR